MFPDVRIYLLAYGVLIPAILKLGQATRNAPMNGMMVRIAMIQLMMATLLPLDFVKWMIRAPVSTPIPPHEIAAEFSEKQTNKQTSKQTKSYE